MEDLLKNKLIWGIAAVLIMFNFAFFAGSKIVVNKAADKVIEKLQKNYSPSPYGPGLDPDRVNLNKSQKTYYEMRQPDGAGEILASRMSSTLKEADEWRSDWEKERGFNELR